MSPMPDVVLSASTLKRIRGLSRPIVILLTTALGLVFVVQALEIVAFLLAFHKGDGWQAIASFSEAGFGLSVFHAAHPVPDLSGVSVETLDGSQRLEVAALAAVCAACSGLTLFNLRQLFGLYARGEVFARDNVRRMKQFALWLALTAVALNIGGRAFVALTRAPPTAPANALLAVFCGVMVYVIARVMELASEADEERREFV